MRRLAPVAILLAAGCGEDTALPPDAPAPTAALPYDFVDGTAASGLAAFHHEGGNREKPYIVESIGGGVALFDAEGDGDLDAYLTNGSAFEGFPPGEEPRDALFANDGKARFSDATARAGLGDTGWTMGVRAVDLEGDGDQDLYLTSFGPNVLYANRGDGTFQDSTERSGLGDPRWSTGACFLDFDQDGDLDLYLANYVDFERETMLRERPVESYHGVSVYKGPRGLPEAQHAFYVNRGDETFHDAADELGIGASRAFGFQCVAFDSDVDGWVDVYVANDSVANFLWRNLEGRGFTDVAFGRGLAFNVSGKPQAGMGVALGDYDGDLRVDVIVTNFSDDYHTVYHGLADAFFADASQRLRLAQLTQAEVGWGTGFEDFDGDGDVEIYAVNGHVYPQVDLFDVGTTYAQANQLFEFDGKAFRVPEGGGGSGFGAKRVGRGSATGDVDHDGDLDLLIGNLDDRPTLLLNQGPQGHWCEIELADRGKNREAVGARLVLTAGDLRLLRLVATSSGFLSTSDKAARFGLGPRERIDELEITWPDGTRETLRDLPVDRRLLVERASPAPPRVEVRR